MTSLTKNELDIIFSQSPFKGQKFHSFIETGTYRGATTFAMEPFFDLLHTIEIKQEFFENCKSNYPGNKIRFHLGDSSKILPQILPEIKGDAVFFLDGHWSSKHTGRGDKDVPLFEELDAINQLFKGKALIIIDDYRLFGHHPRSLFKFRYSSEDWGAINKRSLTMRVQSRLYSSFVNEDRFVMSIHEKTT